MAQPLGRDAAPTDVERDQSDSATVILAESRSGFDPQLNVRGQIQQLNDLKLQLELGAQAAAICRRMRY